MNEAVTPSWNWIWPHVGPTPINQGLDSEMFDRTDYRYSETFVREAIQNSLDARRDTSKPVIVSFTFHNDALGPRRAFLEQAMQFREQAKLKIPDEWHNGTISWLCVEDFNSKGLGGELGKRSSDFWNYWLNFGLSNKDGRGRGGRGIGRVTFLIASRIQSVFGYTRRSDGGESAVCAMTVLRAGEYGSGFLSTHAYLAREENGPIYHLHNAPEFHAAARSAFAFSGYDAPDGSGLALAIPYPHEDLSSDGILAAAIENFAPAIIGGSLVIVVDGMELNASMIEDVARKVSYSFNDEAIKNDVSRYLTLIRRCHLEKPACILELPQAASRELAAKRDDEAIPALQMQFADKGALVLEIRFPLKRRGKKELVALKAILGITPSAAKPIDRLFREGMSLPDVRAKSPGEMDLILLIGDGELATYLNFCEGKAHLDLLESKEILEKLAAHGFEGAAVKRLVKNLPTELRRLFTPDISEPDASVFDSFFAKPSDRPGKSGKPTEQSKESVNIPPPRPTAFKVRGLSDGLRITANPDHTDWPMNVTVTLAYADGSRRPSWSPFDFELKDLTIDHVGCQLTLDENRLRATQCGPTCRIEITGFDTRRELDTSIRPWKNAQAD